MWWEGMFSLLGDLCDPKGRKFDGLSLFVIVVIVVTAIAVARPYLSYLTP